MRYLKEMRRYYNLIESLGKRFGTKRDLDGAYRVNLERINKNPSNPSHVIQRSSHNTAL